MKVRSIFASGIIVLTATSVCGQSIVGMSSRSNMRDGIVSGSATFNVAPFSPPAVTGAPYSGEEVRESFQTLVDGTHITHQMPAGQKTWRDSQGRVRTERGMMGGNPNRQGAPTFAQISDPVAGYLYVLDDVNHVAHRVKASANNQRSGAMARPAGQAAQIAQGMTGASSSSITVGMMGGIIGTVPYEGGGGGGGGGAGARANRQRPEVTTEDLGSKMIDGVLVFGTRRTTIIPEGMQGNDRPMTTTSETWRSKVLQLTVLDTNYNPASGTSTTKIANLSISEPTINWVEK
jgi:hypothetical protein